MRKDSSGSTAERTGGYKDRFWIPRFWDGMCASAWLKLVARNRLAIAPQRLAMAGIVTAVSGFNSTMGLVQSLALGGRIAATEFREHPIFIIGHWRSGTTLLHEYLVLDGRHAYPDTYQCFVPNHHLVSRWFLAPLVGLLMPSQRPMDNMAAGWHHPQEDEFALCNLGAPSPYLNLAFPNRPQPPEYLDLEGLSPAEVERWKQSLLTFLKTVTYGDPRRIVLKSPPHTCRIKVLAELFPRAKFVHIVRDPFVVFPSTVKLWKRLAEDQGLQRPTHAGLEEYVFETLLRMYRAFDRDRQLLGPTQLAEVRYEELVADPVDGLRRIYDQLELGGFDELLPRLRQRAAQEKTYQPNRYQISPELRDEIARRWAPFIRRYNYGIPCAA